MLKEVHMEGVSAISYGPAASDKGLVLRARNTLWAPKSLGDRTVTIAVSPADAAFILYEMVKVFGSDAVVRAVMAAEKNNHKIPTEELLS